MTNEQQRIILYRKLKQKGKLKSEDNTDVTFKDFSDSYFTDKNNFEKLYYFATSNIELQDEDGNPVELKYFYQNYACDLSWAKKLQYCVANKYASKWSSDSCVPTYAEENGGQFATDGSLKIGEKYYYPNGDVLNKSAQKIGTYQCIDGEPKITPVTAQQTQPSTETGTWQSCVASRKDINYNESKTTGTYTSSVENVGNVTLNINGTFTATGSKFPNGGNWNCTATGKIFLDYPKSTQQSATQTKPKFEWKATSATAEDVKNGTLIKYGMSGNIVVQIQRMLIDSDYNQISKSKKPDGKFGNRTKTMVIKFQNDNGITPAQGNVGPKTWNKLSQTTNIKPIETTTIPEPTAPEQQPMTASEFPQIQQENNMKNLNKIIKESLVETKESKKKLIQESKITDLRFKMIVESENKQDLEEVLEEVLLEMIYLHNQGFNNQIIAESVDGIFSILSTLFKKTPNAIVDTFKEKGVNFIVSKLGMEENTYLKNFLVTVLGNTNIVDIPKLFTDCNFLTKKIAESIPEAYLRKLEYEKGMGNVFMDGIRNALYDVIRSSDFAQRIENSIAGVVCPIVDKLTGKFEDSIGTMKNKLIGNTQA
jgi:peptidoglycan hydrolase-like protein with peptidoglycan-binding domain